VARVGPILGTLVALVLVRPASGENVHISYLVECHAFVESAARLQRGLLVELYATSVCAAPALKQEFLTFEAVPTRDGRAGRQPAGTVPPPARLTLEADVALERPPPELYARVVGAGVQPVSGDCQPQSTAAADRHVQFAPPCAPDSVSSGGLCIDRYEASLWEIPATRVDLICKVIEGTATRRDLKVPGVRQVGYPGAPFAHARVPGSFLADGGYTIPLYAASLRGVLPSTYVSAYQAWAACGFSGKRLPTNAEWTAAAAGTTADPASDCNTGAGIVSAGSPVKTGSRPRCVSNVGAFDMVGNVSEWTMDGYTTTRYRGGAWDAGDEAGTSFTQPDVPLMQDNAVGFRCAR
jgi:hypothetical protein